MKPLREQLDDPDATTRAGAALLAKVPPFELSPAQRRRIRARIDAAAAEPRGLRWLRPAFAVPVLLVVGVAGASIGQGWFRQVNTQRAFEQESSHKASPKPSAPVKAAPTPAPAPRAADAEEQIPAIDPESLSLDKPTPIPTPRANQSGPGAALLMEALQARRAGDTTRAQQLTAEYQKKYPNGALKEEALAISFESAASRNDPSAKRLAQKYLTTFPHGRFRKQAEQVISNQR
jgi:hypothetical protein